MAKYKCGALTYTCNWHNYIGDLSVQTLSCEFCWYVEFESLPTKFWELHFLRLNMGVISAVDHITGFKVHWVKYLSHCRELNPLRLNVRMISAAYHYDLMAIYLSDLWELHPLRVYFWMISAIFFLIAGKFVELGLWNWIWESFQLYNHNICYIGTLWLQEIFEN